MKLRIILLFCAAALIAPTASAQRKGGKSRRQQQTEATQLATAIASLDTIITSTPVAADSFSIAAGAALAPSLRQYAVMQMGVDEKYMEDFIRGLRTAPDAEYAKKMSAFAAGLTIGQQNQNNVIPGLNRSATGNDTTAYLVEPLFLDALAQGVEGTGALTADQGRAIVDRQVAYQSQVYNYANARFLVENAVRDSVVTLPSGMQYKVLQRGQGAVATDSSTVEVNYEGHLIYQRGQTASFKPTQVIKGWTEALTMMPEGSVWELYIPYNLAYGEQGNRNIPGFSTLIFKVEVVKVN